MVTKAWAPNSEPIGLQMKTSVFPGEKKVIWRPLMNDIKETLKFWNLPKVSGVLRSLFAAYCTLAILIVQVNARHMTQSTSMLSKYSLGLLFVF